MPITIIPIDVASRNPESWPYKMHETHQQLLRFVVVGLGAVTVDLLGYRLLGWSVGLPLYWAKAISFMMGVVIGFLGNKLWTFRSRRKSLAEPLTHLALYSVTMCVNVGCNEAVLAMLGPTATAVAYLAATSISTVLNFLGMRLVTFRHGIHQRRKGDLPEQQATNRPSMKDRAKIGRFLRWAIAEGHDRPASSQRPLRGRGGILRGAYAPRHDENRMRHEGDTHRARRFFFGQAPHNLKVLLKHRYEWMNRFIDHEDVGVEVGCGTGISREFIRSKRFYLSDVSDYDWLDYRHVDAMSTPFADGSFDFVVSSNMIHHVARPLAFFREMERILKPGGRLLIQEINASLAMRIALRMMRHEGYSYEPNVFDPDQICNDPADPWSANCAIPNLLFDCPAAFEAHVPAFKMVHTGFREFACMFNCGGVIAKTIYVPLPKWMVYLMYGIDTMLTAVAPRLFAMQRQIVLEKRRVSDAELALPVERGEQLSARKAA
ncbi:MAG: GtrA family protein [Pirellulales bacterium]|nr:GtrA family protein [Pirellulales bacterium]